MPFSAMLTADAKTSEQRMVASRALAAPGSLMAARQMAAIIGLTSLLALIAVPDLNEPTKYLSIPVAALTGAGIILALPWQRWGLSSTAWLTLPIFTLLGVATWIFDGFAAGTGPFYLLVFGWLGLHHAPLVIGLSCAPAAASYVLGLAGAGASPHLLGSTLLLVPVAAAVGFLVSWNVRELMVARDAIRDEERWRAAMTSTLAHDVRSPLTSILGALEMVSESPDVPARLKPVLEAATRQTNRIKRLATGLLDVERIEQGQLRLDLQEVNVRDLALDVAAVTSLDQVEVRVEPDVTVWADRERLEQILVNLVNNGLRHGAAPVVLGADHDGSIGSSDVVLTVRDHGPGVPEPDVPHLFSRFSSADKSPQSVGLGLWIVRLLARAHAGEVTYEAAQPGARFIVSMPNTGPHRVHNDIEVDHSLASELRRL